MRKERQFPKETIKVPNHPWYYPVSKKAVVKF